VREGLDVLQGLVPTNRVKIEKVLQPNANIPVVVGGQVLCLLSVVILHATGRRHPE
jgi:hypothetical protein